MSEEFRTVDAEPPRRWAFLQGAAGILSLRVAGTGVMFLAQIVLARRLSVDAYGSYSYAVRLGGLLAPLGAMGLGLAAIRFVPGWFVEGAEKRAAAFAWHTTFAVGAVSAVMAVGLSLLPSLPIAAGWTVSAAAGTAFFLPGVALLRLHGGILQGAKRVAQSQVGEQLVLPGCLLLAAASWPGVMGFRDAILLHTVGVGVGLVYLALVLWTSVARRRGPGSVGVRGRRDWYAVGLPLAVATLFSVGLSTGDIVAVGFLLDSADIAIYNVASQIVALLLFGLAAANALAGPRFGEAYRRGDTMELQRVASLVSLFALTVSLPVFLACLLVPELVMGVYGSDYRDGALIVQILACAQLANVACGPVGPLLSVSGNQKAYMGIVGTIAFLTVAASIPAAYRFGLVGAAVVKTTGIVTLNVTLMSLAWRRLGVVTLAWPRRRP